MFQITQIVIAAIKFTYQQNIKSRLVILIIQINRYVFGINSISYRKIHCFMV